MARTKCIADKNGGTIVSLTEAEEIIRDAEEKTWSDGKVKREAMKEIKELENTITARRLREALLTDEGKTWVASVETLIAIERAKL
jgi:DNA phosphorothioation-dependent restriction protein DptG